MKVFIEECVVHAFDIPDDQAKEVEDEWHDRTDDILEQVFDITVNNESRYEFYTE